MADRRAGADPDRDLPASRLHLTRHDNRSAREDRCAASLVALQPRPPKGILVAMTVMNCTFASSGRLAM
jgi:hypothetical protein